jgi:tRNA nucleotidyltransferase (CCA-adding enzyme)
MKKSLRFEEVLAAIPDATAGFLELTVRVARGTGHELYLVGGPVRDLLLGRPLVDMDLMVASDASGLVDAIRAEVGEASLRVLEHPRFGTFHLETDDAALDLANLRHETYAHSGALPDVVDGTFDQDARRRDFTINALSYRIDLANPAKAREIIDQCGGLDDLAAKRLRVLHPRSFHDDPTRAWRAARFAARLGFSLDRGSRSALRDALRDGAFGSVSGERFRRELILGFDEAERGTHPGRILRLLSDWHVLGALEPGLELRRDRMAPLRKLGRAVENPEWATPRWKPWISGLSIWLAPLPAALRRRTLERFSIRGDQATRIARFGRDADRILRGLSRARGRGAVDAMLGDLSEEVVQSLYALAETAVRRRVLRWGAEDRRRRAPVAGSDLTDIGLVGPEIGRALARIRSGFLDGEIANREEALALAEELARRSSGRQARSKKPSKKKKGRPATRKKARSSASRSGRVAGDGPIADTPGGRTPTDGSPRQRLPPGGSEPMTTTDSTRKQSR